MKIEKWLLIYGKKNKAGNVECIDVKLYSKMPPVVTNGVPMKLDIELPDSLFVKPVITAKVHVPAGKTLSEVMVDVQGPLEDLITETIGLKVELSVADPDP